MFTPKTYEIKMIPSPFTIVCPKGSVNALFFVFIINTNDIFSFILTYSKTSTIQVSVYFVKSFPVGLS